MSSLQPLDDSELSWRERRAHPHGSPRRSERLTSRRALRLLVAVLGLSPETSAYTFPHPRLSLSHTAGLGVAAGATGPAAGIGVDVERPRPVDPRTARFFLRPHERGRLGDSGCGPADHLRLWTVKEALFKADLSNGTTTLRDYLLDDPASRTGAARAPGGIRMVYTSTQRSGAVLSVAATVGPRFSGSEMPMPTVTFDEVAARLGWLLGVAADSLTPRTSLTDVAADSFELVEIVIDLQEEFGVHCTQAELRPVLTLGDLVAVLQERRGAVPH